MKCKTNFRAFFVTLCCGIVYADQQVQRSSGEASSKDRTVNDFVRQFTSFFWQSLFTNAFNPASRPKNGGELKQNLQNLPTYGFGQLPAASNSFPPYPPPPQRPFRPYPADGYPPPDPLRPPLLTRPGLYGPLYPPYPPGRPPYGSNYPQGSFFAALDSISRYDDLRCVPRLLCEVTTGSQTKSGRPSYLPPNNEDDISPVPFLSRDALITLLTILNFVDDSPLLSFARAAFLGYTSRGDTRACLTAYPTCPRDPDQLIDYLNNHNGGFFRFFNQQLQQQPQYAPQYQQFVQKYQRPYDDVQQQQQQQHQPSNDASDFQNEAITPRYDDHDRNSRILNDPIDIEYVGNRLSNSLTQQQQQQQQQLQQQQQKLFWQQLRQQNKLIFHNRDQAVQAQLQQNYYRQENEPNDEVDTGGRKGRKFTFPEQTREAGSYGMVFPDKTGTGNLIVSSDADGNYKILYKDENFPHRIRMSKIRFETSSEQQQRSKRKIKFPREEGTV